MSALIHKLSPLVAENHGASQTATEPQPDSNIDGVAERQLAELIVTTLNLDVAAAEINPTAPLFREGLGLDSIDILELSLAIAKTYGLQLKADDENNLKIFSTLRSLSRHIQQHRAK